MTNKDYDVALEALAELVKDVSKIVHSEAVDKALVEPTKANIQERNKLKDIVDQAEDL
ncbi:MULTISPECIES: hypothetical protein [Acinetobacter]|uniref:hypothetical protein n=1 Tax=Acinetobacter TaxID=469 RepID=UPI00148CC59D|nr:MULTISPECIES: hypothetical protein [Acinetobacter calcoaceticus/baumannii complex]MBK4748537.1 hypothetical protein [Acinetobacter baumannii]MCF1334317.1 hypothetical protein [Acinetobacter baumannii]MDI9820649.1 hypothetical protein [Acinetobacter baumannii]MDV5703214.1 hypothetical protein [Acinetobacter baumannii]MDV7708567.1 hypothetical protein [Acinetobacter pittii]